MSIESRLVSLMEANAPLVAALDGKSKIRPLAFTKLDKRPAVAYQVIDTETFDTFTGQADWLRIRVQIDSFGDTYADTKNIASLVRSAINGYSGTGGGVEVGFLKWKEDSDLSERPDIGREKPIHRIASEYLILY